MAESLRPDPRTKPISTNLDAWFAALDQFADIPFMEQGREQPPMPGDEDASEKVGMPPTVP